MPKVSVIIPIYKTQQYLDRCLESVINQTLKDIEIILVDDGSPDQSPQMCDEYAKKDNRIKVVHKKNAGLGFARNSGMEIATGKYVAFLDSDDYIDTTMYQKLYDHAEQTHADTCLCGYSSVNANNVVVKDKPNPFGGLVFEPSQTGNTVLAGVLGAEPKAKIDRVLGFAVWRAIYSMKLIKENNILFCSEREFISEDIIFHIDYYAIPQRVACLSDTLYFYCENVNSLSREYKPDYYERYKKLYLEELRRLKDTSYFDIVKPRIDRSFLANVRVAMIHEITQLEKKKAIESIERLMEDEVLLKVIHEYPIRENPIKFRFFNEMILRKNAKMIYSFVKLKKK